MLFAVLSLKEASPILRFCYVFLSAGDAAVFNPNVLKRFS